MPEDDVLSDHRRTDQCPYAGREVAAGPPNHQAQQSGRTAGGDEPGGFIPIEPELDRPADRRLGANDIDGLLTRRSLLSEDWGSYSPSAARGASSAASARTRCGARCSPRPTRARPTCRLTKAKDTARRLSRTSTVKWAPVETRDGHAVLPKVLARPLKAATRDPRLFGRILDRVNKHFVRAVLPLSAMWHACGCRSRISCAGTRAQRGGHADPPGANGRAPRGRRFGTPAAAGPCRPRRGSVARAGC